MDIQFVRSFSTTDSVLRPAGVKKQQLAHRRSTWRSGQDESWPTETWSSPPEHQLGILGHVLLYQVIEQRLEDVSEVLQLAVQGHS